VAPYIDRLVSRGLSLKDLVLALENNNANIGAGYIEKSGEQYLIRVPGQVSNLADIGNIVLETKAGVPLRIKDVAEVMIGSESRNGAATENGQEVVLGTVFMLVGENSREVSIAVEKQLKKINQTLPAGVITRTMYDRTILINKAINTVKTNLLEGAILVVAILFIFLGNIRAAIITMLVIPLTMLFTFTGMAAGKVSANLMSLGAIDFGIIIDGAVVIVENCMRRLANAQNSAGRLLTRSERFNEVFTSAKEVRKPLIYGQLIIIAVYLPIFSLTGVEGKMFHPMAFTVVFALISAMILSVTFIPAAVALIVTGKVEEKEQTLIVLAKQRYLPLLRWAILNKVLVLTIAVVSVALSGLLASRMGSEFVPSLDEGDIALHALRIPGTSLTQAVTMQRELESTVKEFPQVDRVFAKLGTAEIATDPMPPNVADNFIMLKPKSEWPDPNLSKNSLIAQMQKALKNVPGNNYEFTQPMEMRFNELISGIRSDVAVKVFGDDIQVMNSTAEDISHVLAGIQGGEDVKVEQTTGLPILTVNIDRQKVARLGVNLADVQEVIAIAMNGYETGTLFQGDRRFQIVVRLAEEARVNMDTLKRLPIKVTNNAEAPVYLQLGEVASIDISQGINQFSRENGKRNVVITANVRERDIGSYVAEAQQRIQQEVNIPAGYWINWGGTFEQLQKASDRLKIVVPMVLLLVFILLYAMFNNLKDGLIVFTGIPFALTGGVLMLWLRDIPLSISAGVGLIALSGIAVLNGLVMISFIRQLLAEGKSLETAIEEGSLSRLRAILITAMVASLGFIPMAIATGVGAEIQRPLATVVIGGVWSSTLLTLLVLPVLYRLAYEGRKTTKLTRKQMDEL
jgi:cobalt-zinc-cadmium resistance protein CzcA